MEANKLHVAAAVVAGRNVTPRVASVCIAWDDVHAKLTVQYLIDGVVTDEERDLCDVMVGELIAEFPDIEKVAMECLINSSAPTLVGKDVVYARPASRQRAA